MSSAGATRMSYLSSHRGPGGRHQHDFVATSRFPPPRSQSLPHLGNPAGFAPALGNGTPQLYGSLKPPFEVRLGTTLHPNGTNWRDPSAVRTRRLEEWVQPERLRPEVLPPAGKQKLRPRGKRMVGGNTNNQSHVDTLIWGCNVDGSPDDGGMLRQSEVPMYMGAAGVNAKADSTPIYGHLPPSCLRTFGPEGPGELDTQGGYTAPEFVERPLVN